jgi:hypothetical protein
MLLVAGLSLRTVCVVTCARVCKTKTVARTKDFHLQTVQPRTRFIRTHVHYRLTPPYYGHIAERLLLQHPLHVHGVGVFADHRYVHAAPVAAAELHAQVVGVAMAACAVGV